MPQISQILTLHFTCRVGYCTFSTLLLTCNPNGSAAERGATWKRIELPCNKGDIAVRHGRQGVFSIVRCPQESGLHFYPSFHATVLKDNTSKRDTKQTRTEDLENQGRFCFTQSASDPRNVSAHTPRQWSHALTWYGANQNLTLSWALPPAALLRPASPLPGKTHTSAHTL